MSDVAVGSVGLNPPNLLTLGAEKRSQQITNPISGRTVQDAIDVDGTDSNRKLGASHVAYSALHRPALSGLTGKSGENGGSTESNELTIFSFYEASRADAAESCRAFLALRDQFTAQSNQLRRLKRSLQYQKRILAECEDQGKKKESVPSLGHANSRTNGSISAEMRAMDVREENIQNCVRVISQLNRQLAIIGDQHDTDKMSLARSKAQAYSSYHRFTRVVQKYHDPITASRSHYPSNAVQNALMLRQIGLRPSGMGQHRVSRGILGSSLSAAVVRKDHLESRFTHGATINTHLSYPIYCMRFDRTGRYFITGADDYLVKLYCLGSNVVAKGRGIDRTSFMAGAVLVCTFRGHAGVINDIHVSSDNAFLATASDDGDCRVWGLKDGTPIAILRGHTGGANMVYWSDLTPYRLITASSDGCSRVWDVKEACVRQYKSVLGNRKDYCSSKTKRGNRLAKHQAKRPINHATHEELKAPPDTTNPDKSDAPPQHFSEKAMSQNQVVEDRDGDNFNPQQETNESSAETSRNTDSVVPLQPVPPPPDVDGPQNLAPIPLPPLPPPVENGVPVPPLPPQANEPGRFIAGDSIDRGVRLLAKHQHGAVSRDESMTGVGSRTRRAAVKVLCVAVCPTGGHFTTGADDGICRVFSADDDEAVELADHQASVQAGFAASRQTFASKVSSSTLINTLKGHLSAITDLHYSSNGDRILSASQKDGVVRIWSFTCDPSQVERELGSMITTPSARNFRVSHIVIKLSSMSSKTQKQQIPIGARRGPSRGSESNVSCDVAIWCRDDECIITSQCELVKQTSNDILPGSQYIFVWDSHTGQCLLGIAGAHTKQCAVVIPHPKEPSLVCSAGADGKARLWNIETGKSLLVHQNIVEYGPIEARDRGQISSYLDGCFSPDGLHLVLTDDGGRVTVLNCGIPHMSTSLWMREQYFANDYYELLYDSDGYCIERGSEQPPHLAPRSVRCSHSGAPSGELVSNAFKSLSGPLPLSEHCVRWERIHRRRRSGLWCRKKIKKGNIVAQYDHSSTIVVSASGEQMPPSSVTGLVPTSSEQPESSRASPQLSRNWRWRDYSDVLMEEGLNSNDEEQPDSDDASFQLETNTNPQRKADESDSSESEVLGNETAEKSMTTNRQSSRNTRRRYVDGEPSSDEELVQFMSSNNTPSGPFASDYDSHYFKISQSQRVHNQWLLRHESDSSFNGTKCYCPQVGDSVVYIPRAHHETMTNFPSLVPPWQNWPDEAEWPVVRCLIRYIRYRFPFKAYYPRKHTEQKFCDSVVAILSLELTGIPELSGDDAWPKPSFITPANFHNFEVAVFVSDETDFLVPLSLYVSRMSSLEQALANDDAPLVEVAYSNPTNEFYEFFPATVTNVLDEDSLSNPTLRGSGYQTIEVLWDRERTKDTLSPWEVRVRKDSTETIERPKLSDDQKKKVRDALREIQDMEGVRDCFLAPVDTRKYSDYLTRVEVPMTLDFVKSRLESNYYSNPWSVIADIKLIRENSLKYNGDCELTWLAGQMIEKLSLAILSSEEYKEFTDSQMEVEVAALEGKHSRTREQAVRVPFTDHASAQTHEATRSTGRSSSFGSGIHPRTSRRSTRIRRTSSALENLPLPDSNNLTNTSHRRTSVRGSHGRRERRQEESQLSVLEPPSAPVVAMDGGIRGRAARNPGGQSVGRSLRSSRTLNMSNNGGNEESRIRSRHQSSSRSSRSNTNQTERVSTTNEQEDSNRIGRRGGISGTSRLRSGQRTRSQNLNDSEEEINQSDYKDDNTSDADGSDSAALSDRHIMSNTSSDSSSGDETANIVQSRRSTRATRSHSNELASNRRRSAQDEPQSRRERGRRTRAQRSNDASRRRSDGLVAQGDESDFHFDSDDDSVESSSSSSEKRPARKSSTMKAPVGTDGNPLEKTATRKSQRETNTTRRVSHAGSSRARDPELEGRRSRRTRNSGNKDINTARSDTFASEPRTRSRNIPSVEDNVTDSSRDQSPDNGHNHGVQERQSPRRRSATATKSYVDPSSSEFDSEPEVKTKNVKQEKSKKRKEPPQLKPTAKPPPSRKRKRWLDDEDLPPSKEWPDVELKEISILAHWILEELRKEDQYAAFGGPVVEEYPDIADAYNEIIDEPMDFRTIEEDRLPSYKTIGDLQKDLKLVFLNCMAFNKASNPVLYDLAR